MITINKGEVNTVILTLAEKTTIEGPTYLFEFIKEGSPGTKKYFIAEDISVNPLRNNEFEIEEGTPEDTLNGKISLNAGQYLYNVYEQASTTNLDPTGLSIVENGRVEIKTTATVLPEFNGQQTVIKAFNG